MKPRHQRLSLFCLAALMVGGAAVLLMRNLDEYTVYFYSPADLVTNPPPTGYIRVGGLVKEGSVSRPDESRLRFEVTDHQHDLVIVYDGIVPALFREGQGVVAEGYYRDGMVEAERILAKHDEYYMPPEVAKTLKQSGAP